MASFMHDWLLLERAEPKKTGGSATVYYCVIYRRLRGGREREREARAHDATVGKVYRMAATQKVSPKTAPPILRRGNTLAGWLS